MNENDFEMLMKEAILEEMDNVKIPPKDEMWRIISSQLDARRRKERLRRIRPLIAASIVIMLSVALVCINPSIRVTADNMIKIVTSFTDGVFKVNKSVNAELGAVNITGDPRIDGVQKELEVNLMVPKFLPEGYKFYDIKTRKRINNYLSIMLYFENKIKGYISIEQVICPDNYTDGVNYKSNERTQLSKMIVNGQQYTVISYGDSNNQIIWAKDGMWFEITGFESIDILIKIAESIE